MFGHEKFEAYQLSLKFVQIAFELSQDLPTGFGEQKDQFKRAAISIPLNIAEGSGKLFFDIIWA